jgi:WD40 repeat protein
MAKRILTRILALGAALFLASCRPVGQTPTPTFAPLAVSSPTTEAGLPLCFSPREILPFAFSPENASLFVRTNSGVQVVSLTTGEEQAFIESPQRLVAATLSSDGQMLAWLLEDNSTQLIRLSDQVASGTFEGTPDTVFHLRFSQDGARLFSVSHEGWVRSWGQDGSPQPSLDLGGEVVGMGISADGAKLAVISSDGPVRVWTLQGTRGVVEFGGTGGYDTSSAEFSPDGQYLAADLATGLFVWRVSDGKLVWNEVRNSMAVTYSPDGRVLAYADVDEGNKIFLTSPDGSQVLRELEGMQGPVWELFFSPDSSVLAATDGAEIRIWQAESGTLLAIGKTACP